jgi:hypothetical protein
MEEKTEEVINTKILEGNEIKENVIEEINLKEEDDTKVEERKEKKEENFYFFDICCPLDKIFENNEITSYFIGWKTCLYDILENYSTIEKYFLILFLQIPYIQNFETNEKIIFNEYIQNNKDKINYESFQR